MRLLYLLCFDFGRQSEILNVHNYYKRTHGIKLSMPLLLIVWLYDFMYACVHVSVILLG